jgi:hypothetical protein
VGAKGKTGSGFAMPVDLFGEPLKPFPIFLRTRTLTFVFDVAVQFPPRNAHRAVQTRQLMPRKSGRTRNVVKQKKPQGYQTLRLIFYVPRAT